MEKKTINEVKKHLINNVEGVSKAEYSTFARPPLHSFYSCSVAASPVLVALNNEKFTLP